MNWRDERMTEDFSNEAEDLVRKVIEDEERGTGTMLYAISWTTWD
jgi:hypothetical protein